MRLLISGIIAATILAAAGFWYFSEAEKEPIVGEPAPPMHSDEIIGRSVEGREIIAYTYGSGQKKVVFVGGIHGGYEWNSVLLAQQFIDHLDANPGEVPAGLSVTVIPNANPDAVFAAIGKEGRFEIADVPKDKDLSETRFNANKVDLNRNFDCKWKAESIWRSRKVSAGTAPFSEPEASTLRDYLLFVKPEAVVFWHSQAGAVYASECEKGILPQTLKFMNEYASASGYKAVESFDAYAVTGDAEGWLASVNVPAISVELTTHEVVEWEKNLAGIRALLKIVD
jgi:Zinc carboxypeptidase